MFSSKIDLDMEHAPPPLQNLSEFKWGQTHPLKMIDS